MIIKCVVDGEILTCKFANKIDCSCTPEIKRALRYQLEIGSINKIIFDLSGTDYISSSFLNVLLTYMKKLGRENISVINVNSEIGHVLKISGFDKLIGVLHLEEALQITITFLYK